MRENGLTCETIAEFKEQIGDFLRLVMDGRVMRDPERRSAIVRGLGLLYVRMDLPCEDEDEAVGLFECALNEYTARIALIEVAEAAGRRCTCDSD